MKKSLMFLLGISISLSGFFLQGQDSSEKRAETHSLLSVGIFPFSANAKDERLEAIGKSVADLLYVNLNKNQDIMLVDRQEISKIINEQSLSLAGMSNPEYANKAGYLIGARLIITGTVFKNNEKIIVVAKIIGTETSRVVAESAEGSDVNEIASKLAGSIGKSISANGTKLLPVYKNREDVIKTLKTQLANTKKPAVYVNIPERHVRAITVDPAAKTEFIFILRELGFDVVEHQEDASVLLTGEGFSETGLRRGEMVCVKARLEVKATDKSGKIIAADRQTAVCVDVAEQMAGKEALQSAASLMAVRLLPKIISK